MRIASPGKGSPMLSRQTTPATASEPYFMIRVARSIMGFLFAVNWDSGSWRQTTLPLFDRFPSVFGARHKLEGFGKLANRVEQRENQILYRSVCGNCRLLPRLGSGRGGGHRTGEAGLSRGLSALLPCLCRWQRGAARLHVALDKEGIARLRGRARRCR